MSQFVIATIQEDQVGVYESFVLNHPASLFYHTFKYASFLREVTESSIEHLIAYRGNTICAAMPLMKFATPRGIVFNSLPFYGSHGGILSIDDSATQALIKTYNNLVMHEDILSSTVISNPFNLDRWESMITRNFIDTRLGQYTNITMSDSNFDHFLKRIDSSARRNIRKALNNGVSVQINNELLEDIKRIHNENMIAIGGKPKPDIFFKCIPQFFVAGEDYDIYVATKGQKIIAGLLIFYHKDMVEYFVPVIQQEYREFQPLSAIIAQAMTDAAARGLSCWNWGGTWKNQNTLYRFKKKWDSTEREYYYYTQLNTNIILEMPSDEISQNWPYYFVVPFDKLKRKYSASS